MDAWIIGLGSVLTIATLLVVVLGFGHGSRTFERLDIVCQAAALAGLAMWLIFNSPAIAVIAAVTVDLIGAIPTLKHSWQKPFEEIWITYAMSGAGAALILLVATEWKITAVAYAIYLVLINILMTSLILASPNRHRKGEPEELRQL